MKNNIHFLYLFLIIVVIITTIILYKDNYTTNSNYKDYYNTYLQQYPSENYIDQNLNASKRTHNLVMNLLYNSENFLSGDYVNTFSDIQTQDFNQYIEDLQYDVSSDELAHSQIQRTETFSSNLNYFGYLEDGTFVQGKLATSYDENFGYAITLSFIGDDGQLDIDKMKLLANDINSESIVYDIISYLQYQNSTFLEPDVAANYYFNSSIEQIAGSISYHAVTGLYLIENNIDSPYTLQRIEQVNIATFDYDALLINHSY